MGFTENNPMLSVVCIIYYKLGGITWVYMIALWI